MTILQWLGVVIIAATFFGVVAAIDGWRIAIPVFLILSLFVVGGCLLVFGGA